MPEVPASQAPTRSARGHCSWPGRMPTESPYSGRSAVDGAACGCVGADLVARAATPLRPVGAIRVAADRRARRARRRRHALRNRRLARPPARLASVVPRGYSEDPDADPKVSECLHIAHVFERAGEFDLIHNSFDFLPLTYSGLVETPVLTTIHGFSSPRILAVYQRYNATLRVRRDQRRRPGSEPRLSRDDPSRHRHRRVRAAPGARAIPAVLRADPSRQGHGRGDRRRRALRHSARDRGDRAGPAVLRRAGRPADRRRQGVVHRRGRARRSGRSCSAALARCCT